MALLFVFPEGFGGHDRDGPASPQALQKLRLLQSVYDAQRGAAFLCRLTVSEYRRRLGFLSNMDTFCSQLYDGWPSFSFTEQSLVYDGPLPLPQRSQNFPRFDARKRFHLFFNGIAGRFLLGTGTAVYCRVHRSQVPKKLRIFCKSGTDSRRGLTSLLTGCVIFFLEQILIVLGSLVI